ncbi:MAG: YbbR-like domain-containing protein [Thermoanaerobaculia bacterium]
MKNLGIKIVSLLLACVVWFIVSAPRREVVRTRVVTAPLSLISVPSELIITTDLPSTVAVAVSGRNNDLRALATASLEVPVDLSWATQPGEVEITLRPDLINAPPDVEIESITPNKIRFRIEQLRQRAVAIRPFLVGDPPSGYLVGEATAEPSRAIVSGPASQILKVDEVATERIIMTGRTATFVQNVAVVSDSPLVRVISPPTTQVTVPVLAEVGPAPPEPTATDTTATPAPEEKTDTQ